MNLTVVTEPPVEPVTVAQVYERLRWDGDQEGSPSENIYPLADMILTHIKTARIHVEQLTKRSLVQQTLRLSMGDFPCPYRWVESRRIRLYRPPFISISSVGYFDGDNVLQTVDPADYYVTDGQIPELMFASGYAFPTLYARPDALRVQYVTGYPPEGSPIESYTANIPAALIDAILLDVQLLADRFDEGQREAIERARDSLLRSYVVHSI